jgi:hypothetical protein
LHPTNIISISRADLICPTQEQLYLVKNPGRAVQKLVLSRATKETLKYEVKMFVANPLLPPISKCRGLHRNEVNASACGKITNGDLVQLLLCNRSRGVIEYTIL